VHQSHRRLETQRLEISQLDDIGDFDGGDRILSQHHFAGAQ